MVKRVREKRYNASLVDNFITFFSELNKLNNTGARMLDCVFIIWSRGKVDIHGLFFEFVAPPGRKTWLLFSVRDMS